MLYKGILRILFRVIRNQIIYINVIILITFYNQIACFRKQTEIIMITLSINRVIYNGVIYSLFAYTKLSIIGDSCGHQTL